MKRFGVLFLCVFALGLIGARKQDPSWNDPYTPTRLEWLALQCNVNHRQVNTMVHTSFVAVPPNKIETVVKFAPEAKQLDAKVRKDVDDGAKEYVLGMAKAHGWTTPLEVHATDLFQ